MIKISFFVATIALVIVFVYSGAAVEYGTQPSGANQSTDCEKMDFHYLVTENALWSPGVRRINVFLEEKAFSEENLRKLFRYLSDKNPEPRHLTIDVKTNWNQLPLPTDCPEGLTNQPVKADQYDYHRATYYRRDRERLPEYFEYNPKLKTPDFVTVELR